MFTARLCRQTGGYEFRAAEVLQPLAGEEWREVKALAEVKERRTEARFRKPVYVRMLMLELHASADGALHYNPCDWHRDLQADGSTSRPLVTAQRALRGRASQHGEPRYLVVRSSASRVRKGWVFFVAISPFRFLLCSSPLGL